MKIVTVIGVGPQFIKAAAVCRVLRQHRRAADIPVVLLTPAVNDTTLEQGR